MSSPSPSESPTANPASAASKKALEACEAKVSAADEVLKQGKIGVLHWATHIKAQRDNLDGKITVEEMKARFKKTRLKGPDDLKRYDDAPVGLQGTQGSSCEKVKGADTAVAAALAKCEKRSKAQPAVLKATAAGMKDWKAHQKLMQLNALHKAGTPIGGIVLLLKQFYAAPKNIKAFKKAMAHFKAPSC